MTRSAIGIQLFALLLVAGCGPQDSAVAPRRSESLPMAAVNQISPEETEVPSSLIALIRSQRSPDQQSDVLSLRAVMPASGQAPGSFDLLDEDGAVSARYHLVGASWVRETKGHGDVQSASSILLSTSGSSWPVPQTQLAPYSNSVIALVSSQSRFYVGYHPATWEENVFYGFFYVVPEYDQGIKSASCGKANSKERYDNRGQHKLICMRISAPNCSSMDDCKWSTAPYPRSVAVNYRTEVKYWEPVKVALTLPTSVPSYGTVIPSGLATKGAGQTSPVNGYTFRWETSDDGVSWTSGSAQWSDFGQSSTSFSAGLGPKNVLVRVTATDRYGHAGQTQSSVAVAAPSAPADLSVDLSGSTFLSIGQGGSWYASAAGGTPPYSYAWSGVDSNTESASTSFQSAGWYYLSVTVTDAAGQVRSAGIGVEVSGDTPLPPGWNPVRAPLTTSSARGRASRPD